MPTIDAMLDRLAFQFTTGNTTAVEAQIEAWSQLHGFASMARLVVMLGERIRGLASPKWHEKWLEFMTPDIREEVVPISMIQPPQRENLSETLAAIVDMAITP